MSAEFLDERRKSLEEEFFHQQSQRDLEALRDNLARQTSKDELRSASGMTDDAVLDKLVELGISAETVMALSLVPLIQVAWADGEVQPKEREAILRGAQKKGIDKDSHAYEKLESWLNRKPGDRLFETWVAYIQALCKQLAGDDLKELKSQVTQFARFVAEEEGGFLGLRKVSEAEQKVLDRIEAAFQA